MPKSSKSFLFPDVNVWLALNYEGHVHHPIARGWFQQLEDDARLCFCRFTQLSLLRLLTTEAVMGKHDVLSQAEAWGVYDQWQGDDRIYLLEEPHNIETAVRSLSRSRRPAPKDWADSYLAAFAAVAGLRLVTFDGGFRNKLENITILKA